MPIYEYRCAECDRLIEVIQKFSDAALTKCESCGGALERLVSAPGLHFKGSGWYINDYGSGSRKPSEGKNGSDGAAKSKPDTKTKSDSETKKPAVPAAKSS